MRLLTFTTSAIAILAVMGCASTTPTPKPYSQDRADTFFDDYINIDLTTVEETHDMPGTGSASYSGTILLIDDPASGTEYGAIGNLSIDADFAAATITGEASGFSSTTFDDVAETITVGDVMSGTLDIDGTIEGTLPNDHEFLADMDGVLTNSDDLAIGYDFDLGGVFFNYDGIGADHMYISAFGEASSTNGSSEVSGFGLAEQD